MIWFTVALVRWRESPSCLPNRRFNSLWEGNTTARAEQMFSVSEAAQSLRDTMQERSGEMNEYIRESLFRYSGSAAM